MPAASHLVEAWTAAAAFERERIRSINMRRVSLTVRERDLATAHHRKLVAAYEQRAAMTRDYILEKAVAV